MTASCIDLAVRLLLLAAGVGNIAMVTAANSQGNTSDLLLKMLLFVTGILTVLVSLFFGGFIKHLVEHSKDRRELFNDIANRLQAIKTDFDTEIKKIKKAVCPEEEQG